MANKLEGKCRRLARKLGCAVKADRAEGFIRVRGPASVYGSDEAVSVWGDSTGYRADPHDSEETHADWDEAYRALLDYRFDLFMEKIGVDSALMEEVFFHQRSPLSTQWALDILDGKKDLSPGHVLCDYMCERGEEATATSLREVLTWAESNLKDKRAHLAGLMKRPQGPPERDKEASEAQGPASALE